MECVAWGRTDFLNAIISNSAERYVLPEMAGKSGVLGLIPGLATYFCFSVRFFKKGSCQLLAKVCARSTG